VKKIFLFILLAGLSVEAAETVKLRLTPFLSLAMKDEISSCEKVQLCSDLYLTLTLENGAIKAGVLTDGFILSDKIALSHEELRTVLLYKDGFERYWLSKMELSTRLLVWAINRTSWMWCPLPQPI